jgi:4-hydroxybenzoate polyprenyltransferase
VLRAWLELIRVYLTPTAIADSYAGFTAAWLRAAFPPVASAHPAVVAGASVLVYWLGMAANDVFDAEKDRVFAPDRPIPSGRVSRGGAAALCTVLAAGALAAASVAGAALPAAILIGLALLYDAGAKRVPFLGNAIMGAARSANFLLGATAAVGIDGVLADRGLLLGAALLGLYILVVTAVSRLEDAPFDARRLLAAGAPLLLIPAALVVPAPGRWLAWANAAVLLAVIAGALHAARRAGAAAAEPSFAGREAVHGAEVFVRKALAGIFFVDAGILIGLAPEARSLLVPVATLYAFAAFGWLWKRTWAAAPPASPPRPPAASVQSPP